MNTKLQSVDDAAIAGVEASETEATATTITKPGAFTLDRFKTKRAAAMANVETLLTALPHHSIAQAKDFVRLHPDEDAYWSPELCFVDRADQGAEARHLAPDRRGTRRALPAERQDSALPSGAGDKPYDVFFLVPRPDTQRGQHLEREQHRGLRAGKDAMDAGDEPSRGGRRGYKIDVARDPDAFPQPKWPTQSLDELIERHLRRPHDRARRPPRPAAPDRRQAVRRERELRHDRRRRLRVRGRRRRSPRAAVHGGARAEREPSARAHHPSVARTSSARRRRSTSAPTRLFVAYSAWAEMTCFKVLGWQFPVHIFDLHTAYLAASNILLPHNPDEVSKRPRKRLSDACRAYGIEGWERIDKEDDRQGHRRGPLARLRSRARLRILRRGRAHVGAAAARATARRCDARSHLAAAADVERVLHWSNYSAQRQSRRSRRAACRSTCALWNLVQENKAAVIGELLRQFDPSHGSDDPIYTPEGEWSYARFEQWLVAYRRCRLAAPRKRAARHRQRRLPPDVPRSRDRGTARAARQPRLDRQGAKLPIGRDGRNRPSLFPFGTATGRNAHARSPYNAHAGMRSFMRVSARHDRRLPRLANAGGRRRRRRVRRRRAEGRLSRRRRLPRAGAPVRPHRRPGPGALEEDNPGHAPAHEGAAARRSTTAWACRRWRAGSIGTR